MKKNKVLSLLILLASMLVSCSDWLDVKPETQEREKDTFKTYKGYKGVLAGCYTGMASQQLYGMSLTMTDIECLACLWDEPSEQSLPVLKMLFNHQYEDTRVRETIKSIYAGLFNVITQANSIIKHSDTEANGITNEQARNIIYAEAHAIRAFCQFDVLRLFGQLPSNPQRNVDLPYSESSAIDVMPSYYNYNDYVAKLIADLDIAEKLLAKYDPAVEYTFNQLDGSAGEAIPIEDDFLTFRRMRFNYWAVKALKARIYLYIGDKQKAYQTAKEIINGNIKGQKVASLSGVEDIKKQYLTLPSECLFALANNKLINYSVATIGGDPSTQIDTEGTLHLDERKLTNQLYKNKNTTSDNRYLNVWERTTTNAYGRRIPTLKKYYYDAIKQTDLNILHTKLQLMPLIRLSEMYLIVMETSQDLGEVNRLYKEYMQSHNVNITEDFGNIDEAHAEMIEEYRRAFYGEGMMFYTYKRLGSPSILWGKTPMGEDQYILPLPTSEFNPNQNH
ncbi:MAG TPA: RagB/SusD family nutrient uptake outer membrane protein [Prevotella sp.]